MPYILALLIEEEPGMTARTRSHVVAIGTVLAGLVLVGCANPERLDRTTTPEDSLARVQGAAAKVTEARSARLSMTMRTTFAGEQVAASTATTEGVYDYAAHKGQMDTTIKTAGIPFRFTVRTLVIGSTVYIKTPDMPHGQETPAGVPLIPEEHHKPWAKLDLPKELAAQSPERLQGFVEDAGLAFPKPADVWIDEQGRLRKIHYAVTLKVPEGMEATATQMTIETTQELFDFGVTVKVTPPPANQVEVVKPDQPTP